MRAPFSRTLGDLLDEQAQQHGGRVAVIADGIEHSFTALADRAGRLAAGLRARGVRRGDRVGILADNRIEWLEICFGASAAGAVVVPISTWSKPAELAFIIEDAAIGTLFAVASVAGESFVAGIGSIRASVPSLHTLVLIGDEAPEDGWLRYEEVFAAQPCSLAPGDRPSAADDALILYTSGSTSKPKAVRLAHYGLIENGFNIGERQKLQPDDRVLAAVPLFWAYGSANLLQASLTHAATIVLQNRFEPGTTLALVERHCCTVIYTLPGMTSALIAHPDFAPERTQSLRTGLTIGNPQDVINAATVLGATDICNIYGSSETYGNCCVTPADWPLDRRSTCQGPPLPGVAIRLVDPESGVAVGPGEAGQIEVSGYLMAGYGGQSASHNAKAFTSDGWYRTGDVGRLTEAGDIVFEARDSEMIKRAGINVSPAEVEDLLMQHASVAEAAVVGAPDPDRGEIIVAFVVRAGVASITAAELIAHCRALASRYKVPDRIEFRDRLPMTPTGKIQRQVLKADALAAAPEEMHHSA